MELGGLRVLLEPGAELLDGVVEVGFLEVGDAVVLAQSGRVGAEGEGFGVEGEGAGGVTGLDLGKGVVGEGGAAEDGSFCCGGEEGERGEGVAAGFEGEGESVGGLGWGLGGAELGCAVQGGESFGILVEGREGAAELQVGVEVVGRGCDGDTQGSDGGFGSAQEERGDAEMILGLRERRVESGGLLKVGEGLVQVIGLGEEGAEGVLKRGGVGGLGEGLGELGLGFRDVAGRGEAGGVGDEFVRIEGRRGW